MATRCAIYIRVSTEDQAREGYSLDVQRDYLVDFAKRNGWEVYAPGIPVTGIPVTRYVIRHE